MNFSLLFEASVPLYLAPHLIFVAVYYESLDPEAITFFTKQLYPTFTSPLGNRLNISLQPYGKSLEPLDRNGGIIFSCPRGEEECYGNKIHSCSLEILPKNTSLAFITCLMKEASEDIQKTGAYAIETCKTVINNETTTNAIIACANRNTTSLPEMERKRKRETNEELVTYDERAKTDFLGLICALLQWPPDCPKTERFNNTALPCSGLGDCKSKNISIWSTAPNSMDGQRYFKICLIVPFPCNCSEFIPAATLTSIAPPPSDNLLNYTTMLPLPTEAATTGIFSEWTSLSTESTAVFFNITSSYVPAFNDSTITLPNEPVTSVTNFTPTTFNNTSESTPQQSTTVTLASATTETTITSSTSTPMTPATAPPSHNATVTATSTNTSQTSSSTTTPMTSTNTLPFEEVTPTTSTSHNCNLTTSITSTSIPQHSTSVSSTIPTASTNSTIATPEVLTTVPPYETSIKDETKSTTDSSNQSNSTPFVTTSSTRSMSTGTYQSSTTNIPQSPTTVPSISAIPSTSSNTSTAETQSNSTTVFPPTMSSSKWLTIVSVLPTSTTQTASSTVTQESTTSVSTTNNSSQSSTAVLGTSTNPTSNTTNLTTTSETSTRVLFSTITTSTSAPPIIVNSTNSTCGWTNQNPCPPQSVTNSVVIGPIIQIGQLISCGSTCPCLPNSLPSPGFQSNISIQTTINGPITQTTINGPIIQTTINGPIIQIGQMVPCAYNVPCIPYCAPQTVNSSECLRCSKSCTSSVPKCWAIIVVIFLLSLSF